MGDETVLTIHQILTKIEIIHPVLYLFLVVVLTILIRLILAIFKALAIANGEIDNDDKSEKEEIKWKGREFSKAFGATFFSTKKDTRIDDHWLPVFIGIAELSVYPILMSNAYWTAIGAWIIIKTASSWGGWQKTRTAYNRFLLGNILSLSGSVLISFFCMK